MDKKRLLNFVFIIALVVSSLFFDDTVNAKLPPLANYYLNPLPTDTASIQKLAQNDVLVLSATQIKAHRYIIDKIKKINSDIIILAYFPTQSYNVRYWKNDIVFRGLHIQNDWWLRDSNGKIISTWAGLQNINMHYSWSTYYVQYINSYLSSLPEVDGVFFDMVSENISWAGSNLDLNNDGYPETYSQADSIWLDRTNYFLKYASNNLKTDYIVINGSSRGSMQTFINGRMFETFPTAWEADGRWSSLMNNLVKIKSKNKNPQLYIFNSNTRNTGDLNNYREMRFGLASSLMEDDVYFSFDYGVADHGQIWNYDEYRVDLGESFGKAESVKGSEKYNDNEVWRRDYVNGLALINPTYKSKTVNLNGEFEKITGTQDPKVNDGSITNKVIIGSRDGLLMLKTFETVKNLFFTNGFFLHFLTMKGDRVRNGFFAFENGEDGGSKIYYGDIDGNGKDEKIISMGPRLEIFNSKNRWWFRGYPLGANLTGEINLAVGKLDDKTKDNIVLSGSDTGEIILFSYYGGIIKRDFYPLGRKYKGGFFVAIGDTENDGQGEVVVGTGRKTLTKVIVYDSKMNYKKREFLPYGWHYKGGVSVSLGDVNGDGKDEIITVPLDQKKKNIRIFDKEGVRLGEFKFGSSIFGGKNFTIGTIDIDYNGKDDIVIMSK